MNPFKSRQQAEELKNLPVLEAMVEQHKKIGLRSLKIDFDMAMPEGYRYTAFVVYETQSKSLKEDNTDSHTTKIVAKSWPELIDKVIEHFEGKDGGDK